MRQKLGAPRLVPRIRVSKLLDKCIEWPTRICGIDLRFSRDEDVDAWYTTMPNHSQGFATGAMPCQISPWFMMSDATIVFGRFLRCRGTMLYHQDIKRPQGEQFNKTKWKKVDKDDQQYVLDAFQDLTMEDAVYEEEEEEEEPEDDG